MRFTRKAAAVGLAAAALLGGASVPAVAAPAASGASVLATCPDNNWYIADGRTGSSTTNGVNIRSGPSTGCTALGQAQASHNLRYDCYKYDSGYTWTHVLDRTTGISGWIRDDLLTDGGAYYLC
ncbi:SH3 domain-containing protein [Streptomyces niveiscabiei]|uniref:SH3 domain-containing protein n=1 Tax=Streptomyces TaxID=1883 RepID=UPI0007C65F00|nr:MULTISPECIES: SH3 domain-containing protein [Streptomyces]QZZ25141.1 SH3 domain-containing protein [Streptomyces sp. ST1015]